MPVMGASGFEPPPGSPGWATAKKEKQKMKMVAKINLIISIF
jgi:hypothetical protein